MNDCLISRRSDEWITPDYLYQQLDNEFHFDLDPCSTDENAKCDEHYTLEDNGLHRPWRKHTVFCNPPYSNIRNWVLKAFAENQLNDITVVLLLPARTDTQWFHKYVLGKAEVRFIKGRIRFSNSVNNAPFPSMIVIYHSSTSQIATKNIGGFVLQNGKEK